MEEKGERKHIPFDRWGDTFYTTTHWGFILHVIVHVLSRQSHQATKSQNRKETDFNGSKSEDINRIHDKVQHSTNFGLVSSNPPLRTSEHGNDSGNRPPMRCSIDSTLLGPTTSVEHSRIWPLMITKSV